MASEGSLPDMADFLAAVKLSTFVVTVVVMATACCVHSLHLSVHKLVSLDHRSVCESC